MRKVDEHVEYWKKSAERNWRTTLGLFKMKHYDACLFFCHLTLEKMLKGLLVQKTQGTAPYTHDLERLAVLAGLKLPKRQVADLKTISKFNIAGRYDSLKYNFYKIATKAYAEKYLKSSKNLILCLKKRYPKK